MSITSTRTPEIESPAPASTSSRPNRRVWLAVGFLAALSAGLWMLNRSGRPELVLESDRGVGGEIRNGMLYSLHTQKGAQANYQLKILSLESGKERYIDLYDSTKLTAGQISYTDQFAVFTTTTRPAGISWGIGASARGAPGASSGATPVGNASRHLGYFKLNPGRKLNPGETRKVTRYPRTSAAPGELHTISLNDGAHRTQRIDTLGEYVQFLTLVPTEDGVYWVRRLIHPSVSIHTPRGFWFERPAANELMFSPYDGGTPRKVASGVGSLCVASPEAVWWFRERPYPDKRVDLHYYLVRSGQTGTVPGFAADINNSEKRPVVYGGNLYWLSDADSIGSIDLLRANPGHESPEVVMRFPAGGKMHPYVLNARSGKLWIAYWTVPTPVSPSRDFQRHESSVPRVAVLDPESGKVTADSGPIPGRTASEFQVDGDYVYYTTSELRKNTFDFLSEVDTEKRYFSLYRIRLRPVK